MILQRYSISEHKTKEELTRGNVAIFIRKNDSLLQKRSPETQSKEDYRQRSICDIYGKQRYNI